MLLLLMALPAQAGRVDPVAFNDAWVELHSQAVVAYEVAELTAMSGGDSEAARLQGLAQVEALRSAASQIPDYPPGQELEDAFVASLDTIEDSLDAGWIRVDALLSEPQPRDAHQLELEVLLARLEARIAASNARLDAEQQAFLAAHNSYVESPAPPPPEPPPLVLEQPLPGAESGLPTHLRIDFAIRHYNELVDLHGQASGLWSGQVSGAATERERPHLIAVQQQVQQVPAWMGDSGLRDAVEQGLSLLVELSSTSLSELEAMENGLLILPWRKRRYEALRVGFNVKSADAWRDMEKAADAFAERWQFDAVEAYDAQLEAWAQEQLLAGPR
ncbi:MAG: hypothetical protein VX899_22465 [Myxococcota bacterium]|nr:hypothetical protein [Myxococcota bacterium]